MPEAAKPDLIIGIDFGMTCTGVAFANLTRGSTVRTIQRWPGRSHANENKVPTLICYSRKTGAVANWGFLAETEVENDNGDLKYAEWFKVLLDEDMFNQMKDKDPENTPESMQEVEKWFLDYLKLLYRHIETRMGNTELPAEKPWRTALVEFIASVPSTWSPHSTVAKFKQLLVRAGFEQYPHHSISVGFTEAEAAAVSTTVEAPGVFKERDVILVCDVGGGTTDVNVLVVENVQEEDITLKQLDVVQGRNIGSAQIDRTFEALALEHLSKIKFESSANIDLHDIAWHMMKSREFQNAKCDHGSPDDTPIFSVPVTKLSSSYNNDEASIVNGAMQFTRSELRELFDAQIDLLFDLLDRQLQRFQESHPLQHVSHLVLSGGLGNSVYVQDQLRKRYGLGSNALNYGLEIKVQVAPEPQLAVCKGVVMNRMRKFKTGKGVLGWRCARASYGTICKIPYDQTNPLHVGRPRSQDPFTGSEYLANAVEWFIHKGSPVNSDAPISKYFTRKLFPGDLNRAFPTSIVVSHVDWESLPMQLNEDAQILCRIESDLSHVEEKHFKLKNRHFWNKGKRYRRCNYEVKVVIGAADINFELWFEGQKLSQDRPIPIEWYPTVNPGNSSMEAERLEDPTSPRASRRFSAVTSSKEGFYKLKSFASSTIAWGASRHSIKEV